MNRLVRLTLYLGLFFPGAHIDAQERLQSLTGDLTIKTLLNSNAPVTRARSSINIPNVPGYVTMKCDFHMHTVFSDGTVWPSVRAEEAWREGLDAIAITDHIELQPHNADGLATDHNRSFEIAERTGNNLELLVIKGSEITRSMPPGHLNAIFLTDSKPLQQVNWKDAIQQAHLQGAFIMWNHPGWERQLINGQVTFYPEHTQLLEQGMLHGIEVVNGRDYYPEAHRWAIEKKLAILCNSDIHGPLSLDYFVENGDHRPVTLVFASDHTKEALKEALFQRSTVAYAGNFLIGDEKFLQPIFENSIHLHKKVFTIRGTQRVYVQITNSSDIEYDLELISKPEDITVPDKLTLAANKTVILEIRGLSNASPGKRTVTLPYRVMNLVTSPDRAMEINFSFDIEFLASAQS